MHGGLPQLCGPNGSTEFSVKVGDDPVEVEMPQDQTDWLAIAWAPYSRMSDTFVRELQGKLYCIHYLRFQSPLYAPFKYPIQALRTLQVLFKERPKAVHVQNPPFVSGLVVYLYCLLSGAKFVLHYHSAAFGEIWDWALPIQKFLARRATTNIVTNQHWAEIVRGWGAHALVMVDPFLDLPQGEPFAVEPGFKVAYVSIFAADEPVEAVVEAAAHLPDVKFYITGDRRKKPASFFAEAPSNITFTGFLDPDSEYPSLLRAADAVMVLTTRNHTLQLGGCEAVAIGKPLITSDWPYLKEVFAKGTVFVANSAEGIRVGILEVQEKYEELAKEVVALRQESRKEWNARLLQLQGMVAGAE
jgi:glycosyltransferase involved in cell wall biosynthesis